MIPVERPPRTPPVRTMIPSGDAGTDATVAAMISQARVAAELPRVRTWAERIDRIARNQNQHRLRALYNWLATHVVFKRDPDGWERVRHPNRMLEEVERHGRTGGDCDDLATLAVALLLAWGYGKRAVFIVMGREPGGRFEHVYFGVENRKGQLLAMDPQEGMPMGFQVPAARRKVYAA